ncbi:hypothetical protein NL676_036899 [Syzygium grande]|nr:hypothetical protein NL676_036899 [Syzygium grande]
METRSLQTICRSSAVHVCVCNRYSSSSSVLPIILSRLASRGEDWRIPRFTARTEDITWFLPAGSSRSRSGDLAMLLASYTHSVCQSHLLCHSVVKLDVSGAARATDVTNPTGWATNPDSKRSSTARSRPCRALFDDKTEAMAARLTTSGCLGAVSEEKRKRKEERERGNRVKVKRGGRRGAEVTVVIGDNRRSCWRRSTLTEDGDEAGG